MAGLAVIARLGAIVLLFFAAVASGQWDTVPDASINTSPNTVCTTISTAFQAITPTALQLSTMWMAGAASRIPSASTSLPLQTGVSTFPGTSLDASMALLERALGLDVLASVAPTNWSMPTVETRIKSIYPTGASVAALVCVDFSSATAGSAAAASQLLNVAIAAGNLSTLFGTMRNAKSWAVTAFSTQILVNATAGDIDAATWVPIVTQASAPSRASVVSRVAYFIDGHDGAGAAWGVSHLNGASSTVLSSAIADLRSYLAPLALINVSFPVVSSPSVSALPSTVGAALAVRVATTLTFGAMTASDAAAAAAALSGKRISLATASIVLGRALGLSSTTAPILLYVPRTVSETAAKAAVNPSAGSRNDCTSLSCLVPVLLWSGFAATCLVVMTVLYTGRALTAEELAAHRVAQPVAEPASANRGKSVNAATEPFPAPAQRQPEPARRTTSSVTAAPRRAGTTVRVDDLSARRQPSAVQYIGVRRAQTATRAAPMSAPSTSVGARPQRQESPARRSAFDGVGTMVASDSYEVSDVPSPRRRVAALPPVSTRSGSYRN